MSYYNKSIDFSEEKASYTAIFCGQCNVVEIFSSHSVNILNFALTTGLRIHERLKTRSDIKLITLPEELRKDTLARHDAINSSDIVFFCLPDAAAVEALSLVENKNTAVIDTSTAHRTSCGFTYGFPELYGKRSEILKSKRIANPGCHASGFLALTEPLVRAGIIKEGTRLSCFSLTGYSGGGKNMIAEYTSEARSPLLSAPRQYALAQEHKHLKEMSEISGLNVPPVFCPTVCDFYSGMQVTVPLFGSDISGTVEDIRSVYRSAYAKGLVRFEEAPDEKGFLSASLMSGYDDMIVSVYGNSDRIILTAVFDNLGKGASGSAIQNMNILLGQDDAFGLCLSDFGKERK